MVAASDDEGLLAAWAKGDRGAGRTLVDRHLAAVGRFFANKVGSTSEAEDLVGETFQRLAAGLDRYRGDSSVRTYLFAIAHNVLREFLRRRQREANRAEPLDSIADLGPSPSLALARDRQERLLLHALRALPFDDQCVLELSLFEEMSRAEIAAVTGIPAGTVAGRLTRARQRLHEQVEALSADPQLVASTTTDLARWARALRESLMADT